MKKKRKKKKGKTIKKKENKKDFLMEIARAQDKYLKLSRLFSNPKISTL